MQRCQSIEMNRDQLVSRPDARAGAIYFPTGGVFLRTARAEPGRSIGIDLVGRQGMLGASLALGLNISPLHVSVVAGGTALRISPQEFGQVLQTSPMLWQLLALCLYQQLRQAQQTIACAVFHVVDQRLAHWLLMLHDQVSSDRIQCTHQRLAGMLGVRRSSVSTAAALLQERKLIRYSRGQIVILNRAELKAAACGCHRKEGSTGTQRGAPCDR